MLNFWLKFAKIPSLIQRRHLVLSSPGLDVAAASCWWLPHHRPVHTDPSPPLLTMHHPIIITCHNHRLVIITVTIMVMVITRGHGWLLSQVFMIVQGDPWSFCHWSGWSWFCGGSGCGRGTCCGWGCGCSSACGRGCCDRNPKIL